jgi:hypothetical protein
MKYFIDEEFIDDGRTIDLISIGIVSSDGREYYAQSAEFNPNNASEWVKGNVFPHLKLCSWANTTQDMRHPYRNDIRYHKAHGQCVDQQRGIVHNCPWRDREQIKRELIAFMSPEHYGAPELWGWCCAYDYVALCQLFGTMMDIPGDWPHYIRDVQYLLDMDSIDDSDLPVQQGDNHNALADAKYIKLIWESI